MDNLIKPDGEVTEVDAKDKKFYTLQELQKYVGGYVELIFISKKRVMAIDEDGLMKKLKYNEKASKTAGQKIVGNALLISRTKIK